MRRAFLLILILCSFKQTTLAQNSASDSLRQLLANSREDTNRIKLLLRIGSTYLDSRPDTTLLFALEGLSLAQRIKSPKEEASCLGVIGEAYDNLGNYPKSLEKYLQALQINERISNSTGIRNNIGAIGSVYADQGEYKLALEYTFRAKAMAEKLNNKRALVIYLLNIGDDYYHLKRFDSARLYTDQCYKLANLLKDQDLIGTALNNFGEIYSGLGEDIIALQNYRLDAPYLIKAGDDDVQCETYLGMARLFKKTGKFDSCLHYAKLSYTTGQNGVLPKRVLDASTFLSAYYKSVHEFDSAYVYLEISIGVKDSLFSQEKTKEVQSLRFNEQLRQQEITAEQEHLQNKIKMYAMFSALVVLLIVAFILWRNNKHKRKAYSLLQKQKLEIDIQREKAEKTLGELRNTQVSLIQSEKMASLGELTAGIAHEIQNPLNFVNNFSEVNKELADELELEIDKGNYTDAKAIAKDIKENEQIINHHGKRADAIVKGMLQHSRSSTGVKELTEINALADEYLRLSYHGLRAKDNSRASGQAGFNATLKTDFDVSIGKINIIPQDIGRVLLNLYNNAFYAVNEKMKTGVENYQPAVSVQTKKINGKVVLLVTDNGNGIPQKIVDKIFQPFFTTKPTGQGTGLGLSLSYDIVKAHGGEIKVNTKENEGSEFIIQLPAKEN